MEEKIKCAIITAGHYDIQEAIPSDLVDEFIDGFYYRECVNKERSLYVEYGSEYYCPADMCDWQYIIKIDKDGGVISLTDDDMSWIKKYHYVIYQVYCWHTHETIMHFIDLGINPDFSKYSHNDNDVAEIENGYKVLYERYEGYKT